MRNYLIISILAFLSPGSFSQEYILQGHVQNMEESRIYLSAFQNGSFVVIDSTRSGSGSFHFIFPPSCHPGLYAIRFELESENVYRQTGEKSVEFIFNNESLDIFASDIKNIPGTGGISNSIENDIYYKFLEMQYYYTQDSIRNAYSAYLTAKENGSLAGDSLTDKARQKFISIQERWDDYLRSSAARNPDLYVSRILLASRFPIVDPNQGGWEVLKHRFFEKSPMDDPLMLYHPLYLDRIDNFLSLYHLGSHADTIIPSEAYFNAIDIIMANVSQEPELRSFIVAYLLEQFEYYDLEMEQVYIAENYLDEKCESDIVELVLSRMKGYKQMQPGNLAPDFVIKDRNNKTIRLYQLDNRYVLVMFWASTCDHCQKLIPELHDWYLTQNVLDFEIVTISIDSTQYQWEDYIERNQLSWISAFEPLGWNGKVPTDYNVYATPSLFLLDGDRKILSKPFTFKEFLRVLKKL